MAHANDGGGSIRIPAACNGLVGLKPTRGRMPSDALNREMPVRIVHDGVVTRSVRDTAAFVRESERVYRDLKLPPVGDVTDPGTARLRIALVTNSIGGRTTDDETAQIVEQTAALLEELGHQIELMEAPVPDSFEDDFLLYWSAALAGAQRRRQDAVQPHLRPPPERQPDQGARPARREERLAAAARHRAAPALAPDQREVLHRARRGADADACR